jgi:hypothetical protein
MFKAKRIILIFFLINYLKINNIFCSEKYFELEYGLGD